MRIIRYTDEESVLRMSDNSETLHANIGYLGATNNNPIIPDHHADILALQTQACQYVNSPEHINCICEDLLNRKNIDKLARSVIF